MRVKRPRRSREALVKRPVYILNRIPNVNLGYRDSLSPAVRLLQEDCRMHGPTRVQIATALREQPFHAGIDGDFQV